MVPIWRFSWVSWCWSEIGEPVGRLAASFIYISINILTIILGVILRSFIRVLLRPTRDWIVARIGSELVSNRHGYG